MLRVQGLGFLGFRLRRAWGLGLRVYRVYRVHRA